MKKSMKKIIIFLFIFLQAGLLLSQINVQGDVSGTWTAANSPYNVTGNANVPNGQILTIEPGVTVKFMGNYGLQIYGGLFAVGTEADTIRFTSGQPSCNPSDWNYIRFESISDSNSVISYARIEYADRGIYCYWYSSPTISNNMISNNSYGIFCNSSSPSIRNNTISNNSYGIYGSSSSPTILNNILYNNSTGIYASSLPSSLDYNLFWQNNTTGSGGGIPAAFGEIVTVNANGDSCDAYFNLFMDPLFVDPGNFNFHLTENSPCIDAGNPDPIYYDPDGTIADIGAFYFDPAHVHLTARFSATPICGNSPLNVQFTDLSIGYPETWEWDFQNNGIIDSYEQNPVFIYTETGTYTVSLTVTNSRGQHTKVKEDYISVFGDHVEPLINNNWTTFTWPYNAYYPLDPDGVNGHVGNACGYTSIARILHYWEYPINGYGVLDFNDIFGHHWYCDLTTLNLNYSAMPFTLPYNATQPEYHETANLFLACGAVGESVQIWAPNDEENVPPAFVNYFFFSQTAELVKREDYTRQEWIDIYKTELYNGRPIMMCGRTADSPAPGQPGHVYGHWWVCDGYNENDEFYINYAYGGIQGYYDIDDMGVYLAWNRAIIGLQPELNGKVLAVLSPNGGEVLPAGEETSITWNSVNVSDIRIEYTTDNGYNWQEIIASIPTSTGSYTWTTPNTNSNECRIRITDVSDNNVYDKSDDVFSIQSYGLTLISPNGGESYIPGITTLITWDNTLVAHIKIEYTTDNGLNWIEITASTSASSGSYDWIIPDIISDECKVKITDITNYAIFDESDNVFSIISYIPIYDIQYTTIPGPDGTYPSLMAGEVITTLGIVTAVGYSGYNNNFFISSPEGEPWKGIYVYNANTEPAIGDMVEVNGEVVEYFGFTEFHTPEVIVLSSGNPIPEPIVVNTGDLVTPVNAEAYEACLVKVENVTVTQEPNPYNEWYIDDGTGECQVDDKIFAYQASLGEQFTYIIGALDYGYDEYGINPRDMDDLCVYSIDYPSNNSSTLNQNTPNPFKTHTSITYSLPQSSNVIMNIYNLKGQLVKTLVNEDKSAGNHTVDWLAENMKNGIYFCKMQTKNKTFIRKMILMK